MDAASADSCALQGTSRHAEAFGSLGVHVVEVRHGRAARALDGLIIPGGESTTLLNLMRGRAVVRGAARFHARGRCAVRYVRGGDPAGDARSIRPTQPSLGLLDATIRRNAYGRQVDSFEPRSRIDGCRDPSRRRRSSSARRASSSIGAEVEVLARCAASRYWCARGRLLAATFHPELTDDDSLQRMFVDMTKSMQVWITTNVKSSPRTGAAP